VGIQPGLLKRCYFDELKTNGPEERLSLCNTREKVVPLHRLHMTVGIGGQIGIAKQGQQKILRKRRTGSLEIRKKRPNGVTDRTHGYAPILSV
jgi:hypothetical protein